MREWVEERADRRLESGEGSEPKEVAMDAIVDDPETRRAEQTVDDDSQ